MGLRAILLGPPGAGKGTQAAFIVERFGVTHVSSGDLFRLHVAEGTPIGLRLEPYLSAGDLVPDDLVLEMLTTSVTDATTAGGYLLDGFPRTVAQAEAAYRMGKPHGVTVHAVVALEAPPEVLLDRLVKRGVDSHRPDDTEVVIRHRLDVYAQSTAPLLEYYERRGVLLRFDASRTIEAVAAEVLVELEKTLAAAGEQLHDR